MDKKNLRAVFEKSGRAVFISHLDLMRTMQRAMTRSGVPVWFTQGFNPHIYVNFPLALSLGVESSVEIMDFAIIEEMDYSEITQKLNDVMPMGLKIINVIEPVLENKDVGFAEYCFDFYFDDTNIVKDKLSDMLMQETIEIQKHSKKKGMVTVDIKPHVNVIADEVNAEFYRVNVRLPANLTISINSNVFIEAFTKYSGINFDKVCVKRTKILDMNGEKFV